MSNVGQSCWNNEARLKKKAPKTKPHPLQPPEAPTVPEAKGSPLQVVEVAEPTPVVTTEPEPKVETQNPLANCLKFKVIKNGKEPACKCLNPSNHKKTSFKPSQYNTGIPTGPINNLLVVDLDVKDDGVLEFQKYIKEFGNPNTFVVQTPSGGLHY